jgi:hypothetical protein
MKNNSFTNKPLGADISVSTQTVRPTFIHPKPKKLSPLEVFINQSILFDHLHGYVRSFATVTFFSTLLVSVLSFASSVHELNRLRGAPEWAEFNLRCQGTDGLFSIEMTSATDNDSLRAQLDSFGSVDTLIPPTPLILMRITEIIGERSESMTIALPAELRHGRLDIFSEQVADQVVNNQRDKALTGSTGRQFNFGHDFEHSKGRHVRAGYNRKILLSLDLESGLGSAWPQGLNAKIICTKGENYLLKDLLFGGPSLYDKNPQALPILRETLQPLDLILTRNSELTSRLLPGYFSHAAVVIGSPEQLKQLGLWSHPAIASLHDKFKSEPLIIESIIPKVRVV